MGDWKSGRQTERKSLIVIAVEQDGPRIGRIRMKRIPDASGGSLTAFIEEAIEPGSTVHTDGWQGYSAVGEKGYVWEKRPETGSERIEASGDAAIAGAERGPRTNFERDPPVGFQRIR